MSEQAPRSYTLQAQMPALAALVEATVPAGEAQENGVLTGASYTPVANITGAASPASRSIVVLNKGQDGNGTVEMARLDLVGGVNPTDYNEQALTLNAVLANRAVVQGDIIAVFSDAVGGTGLADPGGLVQLEFSRS